MIRSMTAFASVPQTHDDLALTWEIRSVNGRGRDLRMRLPEGSGPAESALRKALESQITRGSVTLSLRVQGSGGARGAAVDADGLAAMLAALDQVEQSVMGLAPVSAADVLRLPGVMVAEAAVTLPGPEVLLSGVEALLEPFDAMRAREGAALAEVILGQLDRIAGLIDAAGEAAAARRPAQAEALQRALDAVLNGSRKVDPDRMEQELALIAVKSDITEELDRLRAHVGAARALLAEGGPVGRRLDFLAQEFNREANTLCSKSGDQALTAIGLDLKTVIDQMREQIQNVE
ncbi:MAG: YicC family protein [Rhodobacterales bacterium]|nr:MAG: YicC family protein [Rhodobacterales bacterium]